MKLVKLVASTCILAALSGASWANAKVSCPSASEIQNAGVDNAILHNGMYAVSHYDAYNTSLLWGFALVGINANSNSSALAQANAALTSIVATQGPVSSNKLGVTACYYATASGLQGVALTAA